jgi:hypothetical protein
MACNTFGDDFINLKTSHIKFKVILLKYWQFRSYSFLDFIHISVQEISADERAGANVFSNLIYHVTILHCCF